jgi:trans-aconitate 2-methyltransferase
MGMYHWNPEEYARHSTEQAKWARELITKLNLRGNERVLDIGCGDGKVTAEIASSLPLGSVLGIDSSLDMVSFARDAFMDNFVNLAFECIDARQMTFLREFDVVFSNAALHWVPDHASVLERIRQSLKPSGKMLLQMAGKGNASDVVEIVNDAIHQKEWCGYFHEFPFPHTLYSDEEYRTLVEAARLTLRRVELFPKTMFHSGRDGFSGWIRTTWHPYIQRVPDDLQERFARELVDVYETRYPPDPKGFFRVRMVRLEVEAVRD